MMHFSLSIINCHRVTAYLQVGAWLELGFQIHSKKLKLYLQITHATYESSIKNQKMNHSNVINVPEKWKEHMDINVLLLPPFFLPSFPSSLTPSLHPPFLHLYFFRFYSWTSRESQCLVHNPELQMEAEFSFSQDYIESSVNWLAWRLTCRIKYYSVFKMFWWQLLLTFSGHQY